MPLKPEALQNIPNAYLENIILAYHIINDRMRSITLSGIEASNLLIPIMDGLQGLAKHFPEDRNITVTRDYLGFVLEALLSKVYNKREMALNSFSGIPYFHYLFASDKEMNLAPTNRSQIGESDITPRFNSEGEVTSPNEIYNKWKVTPGKLNWATEDDFKISSPIAEEEWNTPEFIKHQFKTKGILANTNWKISMELMPSNPHPVWHEIKRAVETSQNPLEDIDTAWTLATQSWEPSVGQNASKEMIKAKLRARKSNEAWGLAQQGVQGHYGSWKVAIKEYKRPCPKCGWSIRQRGTVPFSKDNGEWVTNGWTPCPRCDWVPPSEEFLAMQKKIREEARKIKFDKWKASSYIYNNDGIDMPQEPVDSKWKLSMVERTGNPLIDKAIGEFLVSGELELEGCDYTQPGSALGNCDKIAQRKWSKWKISNYNNIELVPVSALTPLKEFSRRPGEEHNISSEHYEKLKQNITQNGINDELIIMYNPKSKRAYLGEGNHRLSIAEDLGLSHVPVRVVRWDFNDNYGQEMVHSTVTPDNFGYVKGDLKPSEIGLPILSKTSQKIASRWNMSTVQENLPVIAQMYKELPHYDPGSVDAWRRLAQESKAHANFIKNNLRVDYTDDPEPYATAEEMLNDIKNNRHITISTANSEHPTWTPEQNADFRLVHDVFGHAATGGDFSWKGENQACSPHHAISSPEAARALTTECLGQTGAAIHGGGFGPQKIGFLPIHNQLVKENQGLTQPTQTALMKMALSPFDHPKWKTTLSSEKQHDFCYRHSYHPDYKLNKKAKNIISKTKTKEYHLNSNGEYCSCNFTRHLKEPKLGKWKFSSKLDWIKERGDKIFQTPEGQSLMKWMESQSEKIDPLLPWILREFKKKRIGIDNTGIFDIETDIELDSQIEHWADWFNSTSPTRRGVDIMQLKIEDLFDRIAAWDDEMAEKSEKTQIVEGNGVPVYQWEDGWTIRKLEGKDCRYEGDVMGHCVGGYGNTVDRGEVQIYSLRDPKNEPMVTMEVEPDGGIVQIQGKANTYPKDEYQERIKDWIQTGFEDVVGYPATKRSGKALDNIQDYYRWEQGDGDSYYDTEDGYNFNPEDFGIGGETPKINIGDMLYNSITEPFDEDDWESASQEGSLPMRWLGHGHSLYQIAKENNKLPDLIDAYKVNKGRHLVPRSASEFLPSMDDDEGRQEFEDETGFYLEDINPEDYNSDREYQIALNKEYEEYNYAWNQWFSNKFLNKDKDWAVKSNYPYRPQEDEGYVVSKDTINNAHRYETIRELEYYLSHHKDEKNPYPNEEYSPTPLRPIVPDHENPNYPKLEDEINNHLVNMTGYSPPLEAKNINQLPLFKKWQPVPDMSQAESWRPTYSNWKISQEFTNRTNYAKLTFKWH